MITLYTKPSCQSCIVAKRYLNDHNIPFQEYAIGADISRDDVLTKFPLARKAPVVEVNGNYIGSYEELLEWHKNVNQSTVTEEI